MNFIVLGAGAVGCYIGGRLAAAGETVRLVGRPRVIDVLARDGLRVTDLDGFAAHVPPQRLGLAASLAALPPADRDAVVLLCVKCGATAEAAREIAAACAPGTVVLSLQNGVDNVARIQAAAPGLRALAGMVPYNLAMPAPGHVHRGVAGTLQVAADPVTAALKPRFDAAGLALERVDDMRAVLWGKLLLNLNNPVNALSDLPLLQQMKDRSLRRVLADLQAEALSVMATAGLRPARASAVPPALLPHVLRLPDVLFLRLAARTLRVDAQARSSMWDDVQLGRTTEIDDLCGAVVRLAHQHGREAPLNAAMCRLMSTHTRGRRWSGAQIAQALNP